MMTHIAGNVTVKEPVKKWGVLLSRKSQAEDRNCQPAVMPSKKQNLSLKAFEGIST